MFITKWNKFGGFLIVVIGLVILLAAAFFSGTKTAFDVAKKNGGADHVILFAANKDTQNMIIIVGVGLAVIALGGLIFLSKDD